MKERIQVNGEKGSGLKARATSRGLTTVAMLSLPLGIGANTGSSPLSVDCCFVRQASWNQTACSKCGNEPERRETGETRENLSSSRFSHFSCLVYFDPCCFLFFIY